MLQQLWNLKNLLLAPVCFYQLMSAEQASSFASTIDVLRNHVPESLLHPKFGIVCGSGLSTLCSSLRNKVLVRYDILPGFVKSTGTF